MPKEKNKVSWSEKEELNLLKFRLNKKNEGLPTSQKFWDDVKTYMSDDFARSPEACRQHYALLLKNRIRCSGNVKKKLEYIRSLETDNDEIGVYETVMQDNLSDTSKFSGVSVASNISNNDNASALDEHKNYEQHKQNQLDMTISSQILQKQSHDAKPSFVLSEKDKQKLVKMYHTINTISTKLGTQHFDEVQKIINLQYFTYGEKSEHANSFQKLLCMINSSAEGISSVCRQSVFFMIKCSFELVMSLEKNLHSQDTKILPQLFSKSAKPRGLTDKTEINLFYLNSPLGFFEMDVKEKHNSGLELVADFVYRKSGSFEKKSYVSICFGKQADTGRISGKFCMLDYRGFTITNVLVGLNEELLKVLQKDDCIFFESLPFYVKKNAYLPLLNPCWTVRCLYVVKKENLVQDDAEAIGTIDKIKHQQNEIILLKHTFLSFWQTVPLVFDVFNHELEVEGSLSKLKGKNYKILLVFQSKFHISLKFNSSKPITFVSHDAVCVNPGSIITVYAEVESSGENIHMVLEGRTKSNDIKVFVKLMIC